MFSPVDDAYGIPEEDGRLVVKSWPLVIGWCIDRGEGAEVGDIVGCGEIVGLLVIESRFTDRVLSLAGSLAEVDESAFVALKSWLS